MGPKRFLILFALLGLLLPVQLSCYNPDIPDGAFTCEYNNLCPKGFFCDDRTSPKRCRLHGSPPPVKKDLGALDQPLADGPLVDQATADQPVSDTAKTDTLKPDTAKTDTLKPDTAKTDTLKPDTAKTDTLKQDTGKLDGPGDPCAEKTLATGVMTSAGSFDMAAEGSSGMLHLYYILSGGVVTEKVQSSNSWGGAITTPVTGTALSAALDQGDTGHVLVVSGSNALHSSRGKTQSKWSPAKQIKVESKPSTYHPALTPGGVHLDGTAPTFAVVDGTYQGTSYAGPFDIAPNASKTGFEFKYPKQISASGTTFSSCRVAKIPNNSGYLACATTAMPSNGLWLGTFGPPPNAVITNTSLTLSDLSSAPAITADGKNKLHTVFLDKVTSTTTGGDLYYATWSGTGTATVSSGPIYSAQKIKPGSLDIAVNSAGTEVYITAQTAGAANKLILISGPGTWTSKTISSSGGADSRVHLGSKDLHFVHVDTKGNLLYSCMTP